MKTIMGERTWVHWRRDWQINENHKELPRDQDRDLHLPHKFRPLMEMVQLLEVI